MKPLTTNQSVTAIIDSPVGPLLATAEGQSLVGLAFWEHTPDSQGAITGSHPAVDVAGRWLAEYFSGVKPTEDPPIAMSGTPFQCEVWECLRTILYGHTWTYGEVAKAIGRPTATRAVARAIGSNPVSIIVPCHRVIGADGSMTGFGGGIERKRHLLDLERRSVPAV